MRKTKTLEEITPIGKYLLERYGYYKTGFDINKCNTLQKEIIESILWKPTSDGYMAYEIMDSNGKIA